MKKLLGIVVLSFLWFCNFGFAEIIEMSQCYSVNKIDFWSFAEWDKRNNILRIKYEPKTGKMNFSHNEYSPRSFRKAWNF